MESRSNGVGIHSVLTNISLFSGAGGLDLGAKLVGGFKTVCYVEREEYAQADLMSAMRRGTIDDARLWDDVSTFDGTKWGAGWTLLAADSPAPMFPSPETGHAQKVLSPEHAADCGLNLPESFAKYDRDLSLWKTSQGSLLGGLGDVLGDLAKMGFDAEWGVWSACLFGAPQVRRRVFIVAYPKGFGCGPRSGVSIQDRIREYESQRRNNRKIWERPGEPEIRGVAYGVAFGTHRVRLGGNGVVSYQSQPAWQKIKDLTGVA